MRVLVITGAGISAESGIPTFRGKDGYWRNRDPAKLATPEAFAENPKLVWEWYRERRKWIREAEPNPAHKSIVDLAQQAREFLLVTQNVDDLHARGGLPGEKMVQIHGDIFVTRCSECDFAMEGRGGSPEPPESAANGGRLRSIASTSAGQEKVKEQGQKKEEKEEMPQCAKCGALMRPGVVWFGEQLDPRKIDIVERFLAKGSVDLTIVVGTTALFGYIVDWATRGGPSRTGSRELIEINPEETPLTPMATQSIREPAGLALPRLVHEFTKRERIL